MTPTAVQVARIGRFIVLETIGQGGMGIVYAAYDPALDRKVAIKVLRPHKRSKDGTGGTARLAREAQAMAQLSHPNVVAVFDVGSLEDDSLFIAMEYVAGTTLYFWVRDESPPWPKVLAAVCAAGRGLAAAHAAGLVHRDFKPTNVLVSADASRVKVMDFGLVRAHAEGSLLERTSTPFSMEDPITLEGSIMGSPGYMAPEQYLGEPTSEATDQYAFCTTLYEALYGQRPFTGTNMVELTAKSRAGVIPPPPPGSKVPAWLFPLIAKGLHPDPTQRHPSMAALLARLERDPGAARRRALGVGLAAALLLGVGAGLVAWPRLRARACLAETERLAAVWSPEARRAAESAFRASGQPSAGTVWAFVSGAMDRAVGSFQVERDRACRETWSEGTRSERQLELRLRCLSQRAVELETLATQLRAATAATVSDAPVAVTRLRPSAPCGNLAALEELAVLEPGQQRLVDGITARLADGRMLLALGRTDEARQRLTPAVDDARRLADPQTLGVALLEAGVLERETDHYAQARTLLEEALEVSLGVRDDRTALTAVALLVSVVGWRLEKPAEAFALLPLGRGLSSRVDDPALAALLDRGEADTAWLTGERPRARAALKRALTRVEPTSLEAAQLFGDLGWLSMEDGSLLAARDEYLEARRLREALLGEEHPLLASTWNELGHLDELLGEPVRAEASYRRSWELRRRALGPEGLATLRAEGLVARALVRLGRLEDAAPLVAHLRASLPADAPAAAKVERLELEAAHAVSLGRAPVEAEALAREAIAQRSALFGPTHPPGPTVPYLADALVQQGRAAEAVAVLDDALATHQRLQSKDSLEQVGALLASTRALGAAKELSRALDAALQARNLADRLPQNALLKTKARLAVADARWALGQRDDARAEVKAALAFAVESKHPLAEALAQAWAAPPP